jgi:hypothetical protein
MGDIAFREYERAGRVIAGTLAVGLTALVPFGLQSASALQFAAILGAGLAILGAAFAVGAVVGLPRSCGRAANRRATRTARARSAALILTLGLLAAGCGINIGLQKDTEAAFNDAITSFESSAVDIKTTLQKLEKELVGDAGDLVRGDVEQLFTNATTVVFEQWDCRVDILRERVLLDLRRLKAKALGQPFEEPKGWLCNVSPTSIDLNLPEEMRNQVQLSGWNLAIGKPSVTVFHEHDGKRDEITRAAWDRQTNYHATITIARGAVELDPTAKVERIVVMVPDQTTPFSSIRVVPKAVAKCPTQTIVSHTAPPMTVIPIHTGKGDKEVFNKVDLYGSATLVIPDNRERVDLEVFVTAEQYDDDHSRAEKRETKIFFDRVPLGWEIDRLELSALTEDDYRRPVGWDSVSTYEGDSFVREWVWYGDTNGEDLNGYTRVDVHFNEVDIVLRPTPGCVPIS